jgi:SH3-like domain-containing protein
VQPIGPVLEGDEQDWRRVRTEDGAEGWIAVDLLAPMGSGDQ